MYMFHSNDIGESKYWNFKICGSSIRPVAWLTKIPLCQFKQTLIFHKMELRTNFRNKSKIWKEKFIAEIIISSCKPNRNIVIKKNWFGMQLKINRKLKRINTCQQKIKISRSLSQVQLKSCNTRRSLKD